MYCTCLLVGQEKVFTGTEYSGHTCTHLHTLGWDTHFTTGNIHHTHNLQRTTHNTLHLTKRRLCKSICTHVPPSGCRQGGIHLLGRVLSTDNPSCGILHAQQDGDTVQNWTISSRNLFFFPFNSSSVALVSVNKTPFSWERGSTMEEHLTH